ncbi:neuronal acetylcholine receptor subunit alpha-5-like [Littorina saxatilis]|uniref:Neurotransmitter-gated ion-channel ligand-binding domain-containing protein n=1 Tax=Littorina saxatilis TaxID=31220 RepID=A0AAN9B300_9CAEN
MAIPLLLILLSSLGYCEGVSYLYDHVYNMVSTVDFAHTVPQARINTPVPVKLTLAITRVLKVDSENQELVADGVLSMRWSDFRLAWEPWVSTDVTTIVWPKADSFWTPDIVVVNGQGSQYDASPETSSVRFDRTGNVTWTRRLRMRVPCDVGTGNLINSDVTCVIRLASWAHDGTSVSLITAERGVNLTDYWADSRYDVTGAGVTKSSQEYDCCAAPFDVISFSVVVGNRAK